jgi:hypothetical protein
MSGNTSNELPIPAPDIVLKASVTVIKPAATEIASSYYAPFQVDDSGGYRLQSEVVLNNPHSKEIEGFSLTNLFEFSATLSETKAQGFQKMREQYEREKGVPLKSLCIEKQTEDDTKEWTVYYGVELIDWMKQKDSENPFFFGELFQGTGDDTTFPFMGQIYQPTEELVNDIMWFQIGRYSPDELRTMSDFYMQSVIDLFKDKNGVEDMAQRVRIHEMMHYIHSERLWQGAYRDISTGFCAGIIDYAQKKYYEPLKSLLAEDGIYTEKLVQAKKTCFEDEELGALFFSVVKNYEHLQGLAEAYAILHELHTSSVLGHQGSQLSEQVFSARLGILFSHLKRQPSSKESILERGLDGLTDDPYTEGMEEHDLGTLVILTNGEILSTNPKQVFDTSSGGQTYTGESIVDRLQAFQDNPSDFFRDYDPSALKQRIEAKMRDTLLLLVDYIDQLRTTATQDQQKEFLLFKKEIPLDEQKLSQLRAQLST